MTDEQPPRDLTAQEVDILRLVDGGATATQIAAELGLDRETIARTLVDVRQALGVRSTRAAIEIARTLPAWATRPSP